MPVVEPSKPPSPCLKLQFDLTSALFETHWQLPSTSRRSPAFSPCPALTLLLALTLTHPTPLPPRTTCPLLLHISASNTRHTLITLNTWFFVYAVPSVWKASPLPLPPGFLRYSYSFFKTLLSCHLLSENSHGQTPKQFIPPWSALLLYLMQTYSVTGYPCALQCCSKHL